MTIPAAEPTGAGTIPQPFAGAIYDDLERTAVVSPCGRYRYDLTRRWRTGGNGQTVCFVMLNPSTADGLVDDPTIRRCMKFARAWGFSDLWVRNLFGLRATHPVVLKTAPDPIGPDGDAYLLGAARADRIVLAWGNEVPPARHRQAVQLLQNAGKTLYCLGTTRLGIPRHPLYVPARTPLDPYEQLA